jgi:hypothetical protein
MRFGVNLPNMGVCGSARVLAELALEAEAAGWDGVLPFKMAADGQGPPIL